MHQISSGACMMRGTETCRRDAGLRHTPGSGSDTLTYRWLEARVLVLRWWT